MKKKIACIIVCVLCLLCSACGTKETTVENEEITISYDSKEYKGTFSGTLVNKVPSGKGTFKSEEGWTFEGEFEEGIFKDKGKVTDYPFTVTYQELDYEGIYTGEVLSFVPEGAGEFSAEKDDIEFSYTGNWKKGELSGVGNLKTNHYTIHLPEVERLGTYSGETESGLPSGQGEFTATNSQGNTYTYTGGFKNGVFHGEGKRVFDNISTEENGNYVEGNYVPDVVDGLNAIGSDEDINFSISDETAEFINANLQYITDNNTTDLSAIQPFLEKNISYGDYVKQPDKYLNNMVCWESYEITQVWIGDFYQTGQKLIQIIAWDGSGHYVVSYGIIDENAGSDLSWVDLLNEGTVLDFYGIPLASTSYENISGGITNCVVMLNVFYNIKN